MAAGTSCDDSATTRPTVRDIRWGPHLVSGIPLVDQQHQRIVALAQDIQRLFGERPGPGLLADIKALIDYTRYHFVSEEHYIAQVAPEKLEAHAAEHRRLVGLVEALWEDRQSVTAEVLFDTVADWVLTHITRDDMAALRPLAASMNLRDSATIPS